RCAQRTFHAAYRCVRLRRCRSPLGALEKIRRLGPECRTNRFAALQRRQDSSSVLTPPVTACDDLKFVQPALECAVVERHATRGFKPNELRHAEVGSEDIAAPAREFLFKRIAEPRVEKRELFRRA